MKKLILVVLIPGLFVGCTKSKSTNTPQAPETKNVEVQVPPKKETSTDEQLKKDVTPIKASTGLRAGVDTDFVSLTDDGLMEAMKRHMLYADDTRLEDNKNLAARLVNGKMTRDEVTGEIKVTIKIKES